MKNTIFSKPELKSAPNLPLLTPEILKMLQTLCDAGDDIKRMLIQKMPKTDLHVHAEAGFLIDVNLARDIAKRNHIPFPEDLVDKQTQRWKFTGSDDLNQFIKDFQLVSDLLQTPQDIEDITYAFYRHCYENNVIFALPGISWIQCKEHMSFVGFNQAYNRGIARGVEEFGSITTLRLRYYQERHIDPKDFKQTWDSVTQYPNPMVTTIGLAGGEEGYPLANYFDFFRVVDKYRQTKGNPWYFITTHVEPEASEKVIDEAKTSLDWFGHGRNIADYPTLMEKVKKDGMTLELCPLSDVAFFQKDIPDISAHKQFRKLFEQKMVSLNSDDPAFCGTIDEVYQRVYHDLNCDISLLYQCTVNGIQPMAPDKLAMMAQHNPSAYHAYNQILKHNMLKVAFFATYCQLLQEITTLVRTDNTVKKQLLDISLHTSKQELEALETNLSTMGETTCITDLLAIKQEIIRIAPILKNQTLEAIENFAQQYPQTAQPIAS